MKKFLMTWLAIFVLTSLGGAPPARKISPLYDVYIGFLAKGDCPPPRWGNAYFKGFSFDSVIRSVRFEFGDATVGKKKYNWWFASIAVDPHIAAPALLGSFGEGDISLADLCPYWNLDNHDKPLKCTLVNVKKKFRPGMRPVDVGHIAGLKNLLDPYLLKPQKEDQLILVPLVGHAPLNTTPFSINRPKSSRKEPMESPSSTTSASPRSCPKATSWPGRTSPSNFRTRSPR